MKKTYVIISLLAATLIGVGCGSSEADPTPDCNSSSLMGNLVSKSDANCSQTDGSFEVQGNGGQSPYQYSLDGTSFQSSGTFSSLAAGNYTVRVRDANECVSTVQVNVLNEDGINITTSVANSGCDSSEGQIVITASGGVEPYSFSLNGGTFGSSNTFDQLASGEYTVVARDASDCTTSENVTVLTGVSFSNTISQIISANCATSSCHGGTQSPDLRSLSNIQAFASQIRTVTGNKTMPQDGSLSDSEIAAIACWVNDGALDN